MKIESQIWMKNQNQKSKTCASSSVYFDFETILSNKSPPIKKWKKREIDDERWEWFC